MNNSNSSNWSNIIDSTFNPSDNFFLYVNNKWIQSNPIPDDMSRWGMFNILDESNLVKSVLSPIRTTCEKPISLSVCSISVYSSSFTYSVASCRTNRTCFVHDAAGFCELHENGGLCSAMVQASFQKSLTKLVWYPRSSLAFQLSLVLLYVCLVVSAPASSSLHCQDSGRHLLHQPLRIER